MHPPEFADYVERLRPQEPALAAELTGFHGLEQVLTWMQQRDLFRSGVDIVTQDEFSYDFLIRLPDQRWLGFGVN